MDGRANPLMDRKAVEALSLSFSPSLSLSPLLSACISIFLSLYPSLSSSLWVFISFCLCLSLSLSLSVSFSLCLSISLFLSLSLSPSPSLCVLYLSVSLSLYISVPIPLYFPISLSPYLPIYLWFYLSTYLPVYLSIYLSPSLSLFSPFSFSLCFSLPLSLPLSPFPYLALALSLSLCVSLSRSPSLSKNLSNLSTYLSIHPSIYLCRRHHCVELWGWRRDRISCTDDRAASNPKANLKQYSSVRFSTADLAWATVRKRREGQMGANGGCMDKQDGQCDARQKRTAHVWPTTQSRAIWRGACFLGWKLWRPWQMTTAKELKQCGAKALPARMKRARWMVSPTKCSNNKA